MAVLGDGVCRSGDGWWFRGGDGGVGSCWVCPGRDGRSSGIRMEESEEDGGRYMAAGWRWQPWEAAALGRKKIGLILGFRLVLRNYERLYKE